MAATKREITKYAYEFRSVPNENVALLFLTSHGELACMAAFIETDGPLPEPQEGLNGQVSVAYRISWLEDVIDMLRSEKPVYFTWAREERVARITTEEEPIGESERRGLFSWLLG